MRNYVIGVDFGSDSVRAIVVDAANGSTVASEVCDYPRWSRGMYCEPENNVFRQHPQDYLDAFEQSVRSAALAAGEEARKHVRAIAVDTTGSTPCPVDKNGTPLALLPEFSENINAMFHMWKDHSAIEEAKLINDFFSCFEGEDYTRYQGTYSSEWYWAKVLHAARADERVREAGVAWVEHSDWIPAMLTGVTDPKKMYRSACAAGHKALWHSDFEGLPPLRCLQAIDPYLARIAESYGGPPRTADQKVGVITGEWAERLGISGDVVIGGSSFDAHAGAVGAGIQPNVLVKAVGTSTVDMLIEKREALRGKDLKDACGQAENSIIPGYIGIEAGQAAFGDVYSWFRKVLLWPVRDFAKDIPGLDDAQREELVSRYYSKLIARLEAAAESMADYPDLVTVDWFNGRRYPQINESVKGMVYGLSLGVSCPQLYRSIVLATAFGSRRILDCFVTRGLEIDRIITVGGIARKSSMVMQIMADVLRRPIMISKTDQACAMGAAMYAATAAGMYETLQQAQQAMCEGFEHTYYPIEENVRRYDLLYRKYLNTCRHSEQILLEHACLTRTDYWLAEG